MHSAYGEIDIIAADETYLCFVEVKTRADNALYEAKDAVTPRKQEKIKKTALCYLMEHPSDLQPRFDVCEVYITGENRKLVRYMKDAFC